MFGGCSSLSVSRDGANMQVEEETGKPGAMDADYIGKLERGIHRWPNRHYRGAAACVRLWGGR